MERALSGPSLGRPGLSADPSVSLFFRGQKAAAFSISVYINECSKKLVKMRLLLKVSFRYRISL